METPNTPPTRLDDLVRLLTSKPRSVDDPYAVGQCYCCGVWLDGSDRVLICEECADPRGAVARMARMLR